MNSTSRKQSNSILIFCAIFASLSFVVFATVYAAYAWFNTAPEQTLYYKQRHQVTVDQLIADAKFAQINGNLEASLWLVKEGLLLIPDHGRLLKLRGELQNELQGVKP